MKSILTSLVLLLSTTSILASTQLQSGLNESIEIFSDGSDVEVIVLEPYWDCGPCKLYNVLLRAANADEAYNAETWLGKVFNDEVYLKKAMINDYDASVLGIRGYPTSVIFKNGQYQGHYAGAITLQQLGKLLDEATDRNKYERKGEEYLRNIRVNNIKDRVTDF